MCGIFGSFHFGSSHDARADLHLIESMASCLAHRGPDGYGTWSDSRIAFGAGRLAIIDLNAPAGVIWNESCTVGVVFNGEIYNFRLLRDELTRAGHVFSTQTDTEVIVHGYEQWGHGVLDRLRGMFAIAIYDQHSESLLIVRDRLGEKPLYFTRDSVPDRLVFASEIKALTLIAGQARVNADAVIPFMTLGYAPPGMTLFDGVQKLSPGEFLMLTPRGMDSGVYWTPAPLEVTPAAAKNYDQAVVHTRKLLREAVEMRLMSDVPLGAFLSGGVDSTAVVGLMGQALNRPVQTFTVGFAEHGDKFNVDTRYAAVAAQALKTDHHMITIHEDERLFEALPALIHALDEPIAQPAIIQTAYVAALARRHGVPVLLSGDGSDELFGGYTTYRMDRVLERYLGIPAPLRNGVISPMAAGLPAQFDDFKKLTVKAQITNLDPVTRYTGWMHWIAPHRQAELLAKAQHGRLAAGNAAINAYLTPKLNARDSRYFADRIAYTSLRTWLAEDSNMRVDKMSMAMSIETRAPFEDHELVRWALSLPLGYKLRHGDFKRVLKDAVRDLVPAEILTRPKWGFFPPISNWLRTVFKPYVERYLSREYVEAVGWFDPDAVYNVVQAHINRTHYEMQTVWVLLMFHMWHALYIDHSLTLPRKLTPHDL